MTAVAILRGSCVHRACMDGQCIAWYGSHSYFSLVASNIPCVCTCTDRHNGLWHSV